MMVTEAMMDISSERLVCGALRHTRATKHGEIRVYAERHLNGYTASIVCHHWHPAPKHVQYLPVAWRLLRTVTR
jgi:hypothetical protein